MGSMILCAAVLATLLVIGGVQLNPGPADNIVQVVFSDCNRNFKPGTQSDRCGRWFHNSCENVKFQVAESGKLNCASCRYDRLRVLEKRLRDAQIKIEELQLKKKALKEQLLLVGNRKDADKRDTVKVKFGSAKRLVLADSIVRNVGADKRNIGVECFPGIGVDQLLRVMENRNFECADTVAMLVGSNNVRRSRNLDCVMGEVYDLVNTAKAKFPGSRLLLSGVLKRKSVSWRCVRAIKR
jgi:hypothetical protein